MGRNTPAAARGADIPPLHIALHTPLMPLRANMLGVRSASTTQIWPIQRELARPAPNITLPPVGR